MGGRFHRNMHCLNILKLLLKNKADVNAQDKYGRTPLHRSKDYRVMELLLEANANPNIQDNEGKTPLFRYFYFKDSLFSTNYIKLLLKYGARIDIKDKFGRSPLSIARDRKLSKILKLFDEYEKRQQNDTGEN